MSQKYAFKLLQVLRPLELAAGRGPFELSFADVKDLFPAWCAFFCQLSIVETPWVDCTALDALMP